MLKNCMEDMVNDMLPDLLEKYEGICTCEKCIQDIKAIALNNLQPLYGVTEKGILYIKANQLGTQFKIDIANQLIKAIEKVSLNIKHV